MGKKRNPDDTDEKAIVRAFMDFDQTKWNEHKAEVAKRQKKYDKTEPKVDVTLLTPYNKPTRK